jgi:hypothetical protein
VKPLVRALAIASSIAIGLLIYMTLVRPWLLTWGATPQEIAAPEATDRLVAPSKEVGATHGITVDAPSSTVWLWIAQVGQGRGGFYAYDILENTLFQCDIHSADSVLPQFSHPRTGDEFRFCKQGPPLSRTRLFVEPGRAIAYSPGWAFILKPLNATETRLIARGRGPRPTNMGTVWDFFFSDVLYDTVHFVMERKMLEGIKRRAEGRAVNSAFTDDTQVLLWSIAFLIMVSSTIAIFFGPAFWRQLTVAWAAIIIWMFLMLVQPSIAVGIPLVGALVVFALWMRRHLLQPSEIR